MSDCSHCLSRRDFSRLLGCAAAGALSPAIYPAAGTLNGPWSAPARVKKVYVGVEKPTWPRPDLNFQQEIAEIEANLASLERKLAGAVKLEGRDWLKSAEEVENWGRSAAGADGILVLDLTSSTAALLKPLGAVTTPKLLFTRPYAGWSYLDFASWRQKGQRADLVASSEYEDLEPYLRAFRVIHHLRNSKVLIVAPNPEPRAEAAARYTKQFGTAFGFPSYADLKAAYAGADAALAQRDAAELRRGALRVVEPTEADLNGAMRLYRGVLALLEREKANAITMDCLGGFRRGELPAYPCVAWSKLNDAGLYGVCEADLASTMTQLLLTSYCDKPGFVSDPVFNTARNEVLHAHCVSATALEGVGGRSLPYVLRSHMEDNKGVSMQVLVPPQGTVTVAKFADPETLLLSTGEVTGNVESERGCRTQFRTRVAGARKMLEEYRAGLHRVVFFGDYSQSMEQISRLAGFRVVREG